MFRRLAIWALLLVALVGSAQALVGPRRVLLSGGVSVPSWVTSGALFSCNYTLNECWQPIVGLTAATSTISTTRNTTSKCNDANAGVTSAATNTPCVTSYGVCIYQATTNLALHSNAFTNASWTTGGGATTDNVVTAPDGTATASKFVENSSTGNHQIYQTISFAATTNTVSLYVKNGTTNGRRYVALLNVSIGSIRQAVVFDMVAGVVTTTTTLGTPTSPTWSVTPQSVGNGWWRIWVQMTPGSGSGNMVIAASNAAIPSFDAFATPTYTGDGVSNFYMWGPQVNAIGVPGPYAVTGASTASTSADAVTISSSKVAALLGASVSTVKVSTLLMQSNIQSTIVDANGSDLIGKNSSNAAYTTNGSGTLTTANSAIWEGANIVAMAQSASGEAIVLDGSTVATNSTANTPSATFGLGSSTGTSKFVNGCIEQLEIF